MRGEDLKSSAQSWVWVRVVADSLSRLPDLVDGVLGPRKIMHERRSRYRTWYMGKQRLQHGSWNSRLAGGESVVTGEGVEVLSPMK